MNKLISSLFSRRALRVFYGKYAVHERRRHILHDLRAIDDQISD